MHINFHTPVQNVLHIYSEVASDINTNHKNHQTAQNIHMKLRWLLGSLSLLLMTAIILINNRNIYDRNQIVSPHYTTY